MDHPVTTTVPGPLRRCSTPFAAMTGRWVQRAACRGSGIAPYFPKGASVAPAKAVCAVCPVRVECLTYALADPQLQGIWGGTSDTERRALRQRVARAEGRQSIKIS